MTIDESTGFPADLRERVLLASHAARAAGRAVPETIEIEPAEAFARAADAFYGVLCAIDDTAWRAPAIRDLDVQGLVGHLIGVEEDVQSGLAGDARVGAADHVASTQHAARRQAGRRPIRTRIEWREALDRTVDMVEALDGRDPELAIHGMRLRLGVLLVVRAFELWTHENDIRRVAGLSPSAPDDATLQLMSRVAARALPYSDGWDAGCTPLRLHLVLTGPGGGTWDLNLGDDAEASEIVIVAGALDFCRLAANRADPAGFDMHVSGDAERAREVLAAVCALALD